VRTGETKAPEAEFSARQTHFTTSGGARDRSTYVELLPIFSAQIAIYSAHRCTFPACMAIFLTPSTIDAAHVRQDAK
jgi:hypothetical protein